MYGFFAFTLVPKPNGYLLGFIKIVNFFLFSFVLFCFLRFLLQYRIDGLEITVETGWPYTHGYPFRMLGREVLPHYTGLRQLLLQW